MTFEPSCRALAIGSVPHIDPDEACSLIMSSLSDIPMWPQLVNLSWKESMVVQCSEGMPALSTDEDAERIFFQTEDESYVVSQIQSFYEAYLNQDLDKFCISEEYAAGFAAFIEWLEAHEGFKPPYLKGQVVGPVTFGLSVTTIDKQAAFYNEALKDAIIKTLAMKAAWQVKVFRHIRPDSTPIIFFDEPYLQSFGSALVRLERSEVVDALNECFSAVDGITGVHCCGNTDWSLLMETEVDIISFDAFDYLKNIVLYPDHLRGFLDRGGALAWGIVPSIYPDPRQIEHETADTLTDRFTEGLNEVSRLGVPLEALPRQSLVSPTCGTGSMELSLAEQSIRTTAEVSRNLRERYFHG